MADTNLNANVDVVVTTDAAPVSGAGFGVPLFASHLESFSERVRKYSSAADAAADAELSSRAKAALAALFAQSPAPTEVAVGRMGLVAQVFDVALGGTVTVGDLFGVELTVDGSSFSISVEATTGAGGDDDAEDIAGKLRAAFASGDVSEFFEASGETVHCIITARKDGLPFTCEVSKTSTLGTIEATETTPNTPPGTELDECLAEDSGWYGLFIDPAIDDDISELVAAWADSNKRLFIAQSSDVGILAATTTDIAAHLKAQSRRHAAVCYHSDEDEFLAGAWLAMVLAADPDEQATIWAYKTLSGIASDAMTSTQKTNALGKNANVYLPFYGTPATWPGRAGDGQPLDIVVTLDWVDARISEAAAQLFLNYSAQNLKIPYTDKGIVLLENTVRDVLGRGERVGHFTPGSVTVNSPSASEVAAVDKAARHLSMNWIAEASGAIETCRIVGSVRVDL